MKTKTKRGQPAKTERNRLLVEYRDKTGMSFAKLGRIFSISRQRACKIYQTCHETSQGQNLRRLKEKAIALDALKV